MEEDLNDKELEERFYSMLHHVDDSKTDATPSENALNAIKNAPQSTVRRYWRTDNSRPAPTHYNSRFQKVNTPKEPPKLVKNEHKPKTERCPIPAEPLPQNLSIFQTMSPHNVKKTIEIIEHEDDNAVEIVTSDEDEVIEVALPPKPTITIDSSDDELVAHVTPTKTKYVPEKETQSREVSSSPVPSIVSSVSDDFIRGDCVAFNIHRRPEKNSFDFSLHEADLGVGAPPKKKKKKKNKDNANTATSTPISTDTTPSKPAGADECFATPKSKAKNKKSKTKLYTVTETNIPNADVYDSDSNQSTLDVHNKNQNSNVAEEISPPDTSLFENGTILADTKSTTKSKSIQNSDVDSSDSSTSLAKDNLNSTRKEVSQVNESVIDLTENAGSNSSVEDIVMANVVGFKEPDELYDQYGNSMNASLGSTKVPPILLDNHDFDNMINSDRPSRKRRYSMTTIRNEMETFYNDSWGGEEFNHREIQKNMSRDKSLWVIDMQDKMPMHKKKYSIICNYCHRAGHRDVACWQRPAVCHMCGTTGHREPKCPFKICVNCGSPNSAFSELCGACAGWGRRVCAHCRQRGHPLTHCAGLWRRHHHTIYDPSRPPPHIKKKTSNNGQDHAMSSAGAGGSRLPSVQHQDAQISPNQLRTSPVETGTSVTIPAQSNTEVSTSNQPSTSTCQDANLKQRLSIERAQINSRTPTQTNRNSPSIHLETSVENNNQIDLCLEVGDAAAPTTAQPIQQGNTSQKRKSASPSTAPPIEQNTCSPSLKQKSPSQNTAQPIEQGNTTTSSQKPKSTSPSTAPPIEQNTCSPSLKQKSPSQNTAQPIEQGNTSTSSQKRKSASQSTTQPTEQNTCSPSLKQKSASQSTEEAIEQENTSSPSQKRKSATLMEQIDNLLEQVEDAISGKDKEVNLERIDDMIEDLENAIREEFGKKIKVELDPVVKTEENPATFKPITANIDVKGIIKDHSASATIVAVDLSCEEPELEPLPIEPNIPLDKFKALQLVNKALHALKQDLDPNELHRALIAHQDSYKTILNQQVVKTEHLKNILDKIDNTALRLNSVLIGRAGLLGGAGHVWHLISFKKSLSILQQSTISPQQRAAIGQHYNAIFCHVPRNDYPKLLDCYNGLKKISKIQIDEIGFEEIQINEDPVWQKREREIAAVSKKKNVNKSVGPNWVYIANRRLQKHWRDLTTKQEFKGHKLPTKSPVKMIRAMMKSLKKHPDATSYKPSVANIETQLRSLLTSMKIKPNRYLRRFLSKKLKDKKKSRTSKTQSGVKNSKS